MIEVPKDGTYVITATGGAGGNGHSYYTGANAGTVPVSEANLFYYLHHLLDNCIRTCTYTCKPASFFRRLISRARKEIMSHVQE